MLPVIEKKINKLNKELLSKNLWNESMEECQIVGYE